jgi:hypothetical protein
LKWPLVAEVSCAALLPPLVIQFAAAPITSRFFGVASTKRAEEVCRHFRFLGLRQQHATAATDDDELPPDIH